MDDAVAGPSGVKKRKVTTYSSKKLSDSELLRILEDSSDEETYSDDDFDLFVPDESDENTDTDDNDQGRRLYFSMANIDFTLYYRHSFADY